MNSSSSYDNDPQQRGDNIFLHSETNDHGPQQHIPTNKEFLPEEFLPDFLGTFPSSSPTLSSTDSIHDISFTDDIKARTFPIESRSHFSPEELSADFAPYCPSMTFDENHDNYSDHFKVRPRSSFIFSLHRMMAFRDNNQSFAPENLGDEETSMNAVEASLVWMVVSLGLGMWLFLLHIVSKVSSSKYQESLERTSTKSNGKKKPCTNLVRPPSQERDLCEVGKELPGNSTGDEQQKKQYDKHEKAFVGKRSEEKSEESSMQVSKDLSSCDNPVSTDTNNMTQKSDGWTKSPKKETATTLTIAECEKDMQKGENEEDAVEEPHFIPLLPIMSDLSIPHGLSSSSSSSSGKESNGEGVSDDASIEVLTTDDIYTGSDRTSAAMRTPTLYYFSYCLEESTSNVTTHRRKVNPAQCDSYSDLLLSSESMPSSSSPPFITNTSSQHPNTKSSGLSRFEDHKSAHKSMTQLQIPGVEKSHEVIRQTQTSRHQTTAISSFGRDGENNSSDAYLQLGKFGELSKVEKAGRRNGMDGAIGVTRENTSMAADSKILYGRPSFQKSMQLGEPVEPSSYLSTLLHCDSGMSTIDLLAESDSSENSGENVPTRRIECSPTKTKEPHHLHDNGRDGIGDSITSCPRTGRESMTKDLEALLLESDKRTKICSRCCCRNWRKQKGSKVSYFFGSLRGQQILVSLSCVALILSAILFVTMGISKLYIFQQRIETQFDSLMYKITSPFTEFDGDDLYLSLGELDRRKQDLLFDLDDSCPEVSSSLCNYAFESSSCNLDGVPLSGDWTELLTAFDKMSDPEDSLFEWLINAKDHSQNIFFTLRERLRNEVSKWRRYLSLALITSIGMSLLAVGILFTVLSPVVEKHFDDRLTYFKFWEHDEALDAYTRFSFCPERAFAVFFWSLFVASWLLGLAFAVMMVGAVDVCDSDEPITILANGIQELDQRVGDFDSNIIFFWKEQLRHCGRTSTLSMSDSTSPAVLIDRIDSLSSLIRPIQTITERLQNLSSSGMYQNLCGRDEASVLQALEDMGSQLCSDAEFVTNAYLELTSCNYSSWTPLYNTILDDTICYRGLGSLTWTVVMEVSILFFAVVLWVFRSAFVVSSDTIPEMFSDKSNSINML